MRSATRSHDFDGAGRARHDAGAQAGQIEAVELRMLQFGDEHGGHAVERGGALGVDRFERGERVELRARAGSAPRRSTTRHHGADHAAEAVVQRHGRADAVLFGGVQRERDRHAVVDQVAVREQHALGRPGGAGGVLDVGDVVRAWRRPRRSRAPPASIASQECLAEPDHMLQRAALAVARFVEDVAVVGARIVLAQEEGADARLLQDVAQFVRAVGGIDVDQHDAGARGGVLQQDPLDAVAGPDADAVAGRESQAGESARDARDFAIQLAPGEADVLVADDERVPVGKLRRRGSAPARWSSPAGARRPRERSSRGR